MYFRESRNQPNLSNRTSRYFDGARKERKNCPQYMFLKNYAYYDNKQNRETNKNKLNFKLSYVYIKQ